MSAANCGLGLYPMSGHLVGAPREEELLPEAPAEARGEGVLVRLDPEHASDAGVLQLRDHAGLQFRWLGEGLYEAPLEHRRHPREARLLHDQAHAVGFRDLPERHLNLYRWPGVLVEGQGRDAPVPASERTHDPLPSRTAPRWCRWARRPAGLPCAPRWWRRWPRACRPYGSRRPSGCRARSRTPPGPSRSRTRPESRCGRR